MCVKIASFTSYPVFPTGVSSVDWWFLVGVAGDARGCVGLAGRLVHALFQDGAGASGPAWLASYLRRPAAYTVG